ncbi:MULTISPECIES: hypothetical protein [Leptolyngbya]|uniref:hypothetical protein n=1 Tax=Leptolyngbya TaxID=47251 RepID=UPI001689F948|nr:hypothetical protein [Leptolyngbya sp. FACHB-1624]MBD1857441.1 hypothetical protein [Leptolyngbya sp. FACHB-1624]
MPSAKRISVTITNQLQATLNSLWRHYPDLEGHLLESIQFLMIYGSEAISRDRKFKQAQPDEEITTQPTGEINPLPSRPEPEQKMVNPDNDW